MEKSVGQRNPQFCRFAEKPLITELFPSQASVIFQLLGVDPKEDPNLRILDEIPEDNLILVHYLEPTLGSRNVRGVIIDVERNQIVAESFPFTKEYLPSNEKAKDIPLDVSCEVTKAFEGTILRVFRGRVTKKWYLSTHRKINGYRSRWSPGASFGQMFEEIWDTNVPWEIYMTPGNCYVFLLSHGANRLVCHIPEPCLHHVQTFEPQAGKMSATFSKLLKAHPNVRNQTILNVETTEDLIKEAESLDWRECSGLLVTQYSTGEVREILDCWKLVPEGYHQRRGIRGNEPNFRFRYLQLREEKGTNQIRTLFPEKKELFDKVEKYLKEVPGFLSELFTERYQDNKFVYLPRELHFVLEKTHKTYDNELNLYDNLEKNMNLCNARQINAMIREMLQDRKDQLETKDQ